MACDIIIPVWNQLPVTRDCIESIRKYALPGGSSLIVIDNASGKETADYLRGLEGGGALKVRVLRNEENLGFVKAVNQGIAASAAPYVCLLNNDTIVTDGWLDEMIAVAESAADIGVVNPSSNNLGQRPADGEPVEEFARHLRRDAGKCIELGSAVGFCMLIKRKVIDSVGLFDEIYGMGNFEDTDYSRRAAKAGYRLVRALAAYVYHRESSSFGKVRTFDDDFRRNRQIYEFRWGRPKRVACVLDIYDANALKKLQADSVAQARSGNWVWYFHKRGLAVPQHSNIIGVELPEKNFHLHAAFRILKKKKRYSEIMTGDARFGRILESLAFVHKAKVGYF